MNHKLIFHITSRSQWQKARELGMYEADSLKIEGFIHFSSLDRLVDTANLIFSGRSGLVLLCVTSEKLQAELKYEEVSGVGIFPHLYGVLNLDAVENVLDFEPNLDGKFELPKHLTDVK
jgi:uncharacterized protein (DUF952 family)